MNDFFYFFSSSLEQTTRYSNARANKQQMIDRRQRFPTKMFRNYNNNKKKEGVSSGGGGKGQMR